MHFSRMTEFHCLASKDFRYIYEHPTSGDGASLWPLFYHRGRTESLTSTFYKSRQPVPTPLWDEKSLTFKFSSFRTRKTIGGIDFSNCLVINYESAQKT